MIRFHWLITTSSVGWNLPLNLFVYSFFKFLKLHLLFIFVYVNMDQGIQVDARKQVKGIGFSFFHLMGTRAQT